LRSRSWRKSWRSDAVKIRAAARSRRLVRLNELTGLISDRRAAFRRFQWTQNISPFCRLCGKDFYFCALLA
jgi:hypothetical protein